MFTAQSITTDNQMKYYIGTAGWSYKDWEGLFYPRKQGKSFDKLLYYASFFNIAEVNASYYTYLNPVLVSSWAAKLEENPGFTFTIKLHQDITHKRTGSNKNYADTREVLNILSKQGRLKGVLAQFPYSFQFSGENRSYLMEISSKLSEFPIFYEFRHLSWMKKDALEFIENASLQVCAIDLPLIGDALPFRFSPHGTIQYIRFHGRNSVAWLESIKSFAAGNASDDPNARYNYNYSPSEMQELRMKIENEINPETEELIVIFNNHPFGYAPANALEMKYLLERISNDIPLHLALNFPRLSSYNNH